MDALLSHPAVQDMIDFSRPVGLLLFAILHHMRDDENPEAIAARLRAPLAPGSHLAISHFCNPGERLPEVAMGVLHAEELFNQTMGTGRWRRESEILSYFGDFELLEPGLVPLPDWRPDPDEPPVRLGHAYHAFVGGVARRP